MDRIKKTMISTAVLCGAALMIASTGPKEISNETVGDGEILDVINIDEIYTEDEGAVVIEGTGDAVFWSMERVRLNPGFRASPTEGGYFQATVEADSDGDGMPDWWETLHGLNPADPTDASGDGDGDGLVAFFEYIYDRDPSISESGAASVPTWFVQKQGGGHYNWDPNVQSWVDPENSGMQLSVSQPGNY